MFLDQRDNRQRIRRMARDKSVLNLFAFTCGFSVAAAVGGAAMTASVDLSKKSLAWGKRNFTANDLPLAQHQFYCSDTFDYYKRAVRQGHRYDIIILDPPTFARGTKPGRSLQTGTDMVRLIEGAMPLLVPDGLLLVATNHRDRSVGWLRQQVEAGVGPRRVKIVDAPSPPLDFAGSREAAKTIFARIGDAR